MDKEQKLEEFADKSESETGGITDKTTRHNYVYTLRLQSRYKRDLSVEIPQEGLWIHHS